MLELRPEEFAERLLASEHTRVMVLGGSQGEPPRASDPEFDSLARFFGGDQRDFRGHEAVFLGVGRESRALFGVFIHQTHRGQAQGGVRFGPYGDLEHFLRDGLRLAVGMGRKCALADLWWAGGKAIIAAPGEAPGSSPSDPAARECIFLPATLRRRAAGDSRAMEGVLRVRRRLSGSTASPVARPSAWASRADWL